MSDLSDLIADTFPANGDVGVPLLSNITITLSGLDYDATSLVNGFFIEGPDTDQFVGPGLIGLSTPPNVSQGDVDDFLQSPGYQGIVQGTVTVSGIAGQTVVTFDPTLPMAALTEYRVNMTSILNVDEVTIDGFVTLAFTTGSGSIEELPANISTSVLSVAIPEAAAVGLGTSAIPFEIIKTNPKDHSIQNSLDLREINIDFNKPINAASLTNNVEVKTVPATDHPNASTNSLGDLAISTEVVGNRLKIKI